MKTFDAIIKTQDEDKQGWGSVKEAQSVFDNATMKECANIFDATTDSPFAYTPVIYGVIVTDCKWKNSELTLKLKLDTYRVSERMVYDNLKEGLEEFFNQTVEILDLRETNPVEEEFDLTRVYSWFNADELRPGDVVYVSDYPSGLASAFTCRNNIGTIEQIKPSECGLRFVIRDKKYEDFHSWAYAYLIERAPYIEPEEEPKLDVNVDVTIKSTSDVGSIKVQINGVEVAFKSVEDAKKVLSSLKED
jgi:hypothetical protein